MFLERGYDAVTVAEVAREAGVSSVTVFNHFPRKEDLFLDRSDEAIALVRSAIRDRAPGLDTLAALGDLAFRLFDERHSFSGLDPRSAQFFRTIVGSPSLIARAREIAAELQGALAADLERDEGFSGDAPLLAALFVAGYSAVMITTAGRGIAGEPVDSLIDDHGVRLKRLFESLRHGLAL